MSALKGLSELVVSMVSITSLRAIHSFEKKPVVAN